MGRGLSVVGSVVAPFPLSESVRTAAALVIPDTPTVADLGSVTLPGGNISKKIECTVEIVTDGAQTISLHLYRDGAELVAGDAYVHIIEGATTETLNAHWYDEDSVSGSVTYSVRASSTAGATATANNRRVTVTSTGGD